MQALYTQEQFDQAKSRDLLPLQCKQCKVTFSLAKHRIQSNIVGKQGRTGEFCSNNCQKINQTITTIVNCDMCKEPFKKSPARLLKSKHHFCCQSCAAKHHNAHKKGGCRVSKLERWLQTQLPIAFPNLEFHFNKCDTINAELDIYIPSLKLAFELNGIFHYEPIFGTDKLSSCQNNDKRKMQACIEKGIGLCIIDISHEKYFKEDKSKKFLDIIINIIKNQLLGTSSVENSTVQ